LKNFKATIDGAVVKANYRSKDPELAEKILSVWVDIYRQRRIEVYSSSISPEFLSKRSEQIMEEIGKKKDELANFIAQFKVSSIRNQKVTITDQINTLRRSISGLKAEVIASEFTVSSLEKALSEQPESVELSRTTFENAERASLKARLIDLRVQEADLAARFSDNDRQLLNVRQQIGVIEEAVATEPRILTQISTGLNSVRQAIENQLETERSTLFAEKASVNALEEELAKSQVTLDQLLSHAAAEEQMMNEIELLENSYESYQDSLRRAELSAALDQGMIGSISIVQPSTVSLEPVSPTKTRGLILGLLLALFVSVGLGVVMEFTDNSLRSTEDVKKRLHIPVLCTVSDEEFKKCT